MSKANYFNIENVYKDVSHIWKRPLVRDRKWEPVSFHRNYFFVADNVVHIYMKNMHKINGLYKLMIDLH